MIWFSLPEVHLIWFFLWKISQIWIRIDIDYMWREFLRDLIPRSFVIMKSLRYVGPSVTFYSLHSFTYSIIMLTKKLLTLKNVRFGPIVGQRLTRENPSQSSGCMSFVAYRGTLFLSIVVFQQLSKQHICNAYIRRYTTTDLNDG